MPRFAVLALLTSALAACGGGNRGQPRPAVSATLDAGGTPSAECPVTAPNHRIPPGQGENPGANEAPYLGNRRLWTLLMPDGVVRRKPEHDGTIEEKFPWWRGEGVHGRLTISGRRLDAPAPPLRSAIPSGYGLDGFQASAIVFPTPGCWSVTGTAAHASPSFITLVASVRPG